MTHTRLPILCSALLLAAAQAFAVDYGLMLNQSPTLKSTGADNEKIVSYTVSAVPWFSAAFDKGSLFFSGSLTGTYDPNARQTGANENDWTFVPDLLRFEGVYVPEPGTLVRAGRINYTAPAPYVASGLFDGIAGQIGIAGKAVVSAGIYYTGLLWKKSAYITISPQDAAEYAKGTRLDESYLAPKRVMFNVGVETAGLFLPSDYLQTAVIGQFDLRAKGKIHSQYLSMAYGMPILDYGFSVNAAADLTETPDAKKQIGFGMAAGLDAYWRVPTAIQDRLSFSLLWTSPGIKDGISAFAPITTEPIGRVLQAKPSGLMQIGLSYQARPTEQMSASVEASYFLRGDRSTFTDVGLKYEDKPALGGEIYGTVQYTPVSDVSANLSAGAFFPQMGNAYGTDAKTHWTASLGLLVSVW